MSGKYPFGKELFFNIETLKPWVEQDYSFFDMFLDGPAPINLPQQMQQYMVDGYDFVCFKWRKHQTGGEKLCILWLYQQEAL